MEEKRTNQTHLWVKIKKLSELYIDLSTRKLEELKKDKLISFIKVGDNILYDPNVVAKEIENMNELDSGD